MGKRLAIYSVLLGATLALAALGFVKLGASLAGRPDAHWPWREVKSEPQSATSPHTGDGWIHFERTTFVDVQGNFVSAGVAYAAQESRQTERQPIVIKTNVGIMYKITVLGWQGILHGIKRPTLAVDVQALRWVDVIHTGIAGQER